MIETIEQIFLAIIITLLGVNSVIELLDHIGIPIPFLEKRRLQRQREVIKAVLDELELPYTGRVLRQLDNFHQAKTRIPPVDTETLLNALIRKYARHVGKTAVGLYEPVELEYYIDFMAASADFDEVETLARILGSLIVQTLSSLAETDIHFEKIATPKSGNPTLGMFVAMLLRKPCVLINLRSPLIEDTVDGTINAGERVVIVHDIATTGHRLADCVSEIAKRGGVVKHVFVLVERTDGHLKGKLLPKELLADIDVRLHSAVRIDDARLRTVLGC